MNGMIKDKTTNCVVFIIQNLIKSEYRKLKNSFKKELFEDVASQLDQKGHPNFQVQFSFWTIHKGYRAMEIPIIFEERAADRGQSKLSVKKELPPFLKLVVRLMNLRLTGRAK